MKARLTTALAVSIILGSGSTVLGKPISRIISEMGLSPADFQIVNATADAMLKGGTPQVGAESSWSSNDTGSKGTIRVRDVRDNCVHLQHFIQAGGSDNTREVRTRRCRDAEGNWLLAP